MCQSVLQTQIEGPCFDKLAHPRHFRLYHVVCYLRISNVGTSNDIFDPRIQQSNARWTWPSFWEPTSPNTREASAFMNSLLRAP